MKSKKMLWIFAVIFLALASSAFGSRLIGFNQIQFSEDLSINSSTLALMTANTTRVFVAGDGAVGIGTVNPSANLEVVGKVNITGNLSVGKNINIVNGSLYQPVYPSDDELVLYLPFSENADNISNRTYDRSPYGNDGTLRNMNIGNDSWVLGKYGYAMNLDGVDDFIDVANHSALFINGSFTLEAWIKTSTNGYMAIVGNSNFANTPSVRGYGLRIDGSAAQIFMRLGNDTSGTQIDVTGRTSLNDGRWHHVAGRYDRANIKVYVDGIEEGSTAFAGSIIYDGSNVRVGRSSVSSGSPNNFNGTIDEVRIYKRALAPEEIRTHYLRGSGFGAMGAITADKFRVVNTSGSRIFEVNQTGATIAPGGTQRLTIDSSGNVGIGTTSPAGKLHVYSSGSNHDTYFESSGADSTVTINSTANSILKLTSAGTGESYLDFGTNGQDSNLYIRGDNSGSTLVTILDSGNVGIGTTAPENTLNVKGSAIETGIIITHNSASASNWTLKSGINGVNHAYFAIGNGTNEILTITPSMQVGINNTSPTANLDVVGTFSVKTGSSTQGLFQDSSGNVGIGTTGPQNKLEVIGAVTVAGSLNASSLNVTGNAYFATSSGSVGIGTTAPLNTLHVNGSGAQGGFRVTNESGTNVFFVNSTSGNVGIGTSSPTQTLHVGGGTDTPGISATTLYVAGTNSQAITVRDTDDDVEGSFIAYGGGTNRVDIGAYTNHPVSFISNNAEAIRIAAGGNVGIGASNPGQKLTVIGTVNVSQGRIITAGNSGDTTETGQGIIIDNTGYGGHLARYKIVVYNDVNQLDFRVNTAADGTFSTENTLMTIQQSGDVGIGATNPAHKLTVAGNVNISGNITLGQSIYLAENQSLYQPVYPSDDGLVLYMPFNAPNGTTQYDRSPYGNDGAQEGNVNCNASYGKYGTACSFDGVTGDVEIGTNINQYLEFGNKDHSVEAWIYLRDSDETLKYILVEGNTEQDYRFGILTQTSINTWQIACTETVTTTRMTANEWHHVAIVYDFSKTSNNASIYIDGFLDGQGNRISACGSLDQPLQIGGDGTVGRMWNGTIDEVRIYKRALAAEEIRTHYLRGSGFGAMGAITADKFRVVNTSGSRIFEVNQSGVTFTQGTLSFPDGTSMTSAATFRNGSDINVTNFVANNTLFVNGSSVGIGTAEPTTKLHIRVLDSGSLTPALFLEETVNTDGGIKITPNTDAAGGSMWFAGNVDTSTDGVPSRIDSQHANRYPGVFGYFASSVATDSRFYFLTANGVGNDQTLNERMSILQTGSIGINDSTPSETLTVNGTMNIRPLGTSTLYVGKSGSVGIGTTTPLNTLHVNGSGAQGGFRVTNESGTNVFFVNSTSGNVGIGTTHPVAPLTIAKTSAAASVAQGTVIELGVHPSGRGWIQTYGMDLALNELGNDVGIGTTSPNYLLQVASGTDGRSVNLSNVLYVNGSSGNVGIGTTSPDAKLEVVGNISVIDGAGKILFSPDKYLYEDQSDGEAIKLRLNTAQGNESFVIEDENANKKFSFNVDSGQSSWLNSGNVGIGTTAPQALLHISTNAGAGTGPSWILDNPGGTTGKRVFDATLISTSGAERMDFRLLGDAGTTVTRTIMTLKNDGNVGISNTIPNATLHVAGTTILGGEFNVTGYSKNATFQGDVRIIGTLYGGSPLKIAGGLNVTSGDLTIPAGKKVATPVVNSTANSNLTITSATGSVIIRLG